MINKAERISIINNAPPNGELKSINYKGNNELKEVKEIPLEALLYNPYNGRIRSAVISHELNFKKLNPEIEADKLIIEQYLYDSASYKNEKTIESIEEKGQQEVGIITKDGVIIDGNRRALLINILNRRNGTSTPFKAIVLPDELQGNEREVMLLETSYQMGIDSKVDYNPVEKYLRCNELLTNHGLSEKAIAAVMAESEKKIEEYLGILNLMNEYLARINTPKIYTRLEKREGHFVDLNTYLKTYSNKKSHTVKWDYTIADIQNMKHAYFDYIRLGIPVHRARVIGKSSSSNSFFCQKNIWVEFITEHENIVQSYADQDFNLLKQSKPENRNEDIIRELDVKWRESLESKLTENLAYSEGILKDHIESYNPTKILKRILNNLGQIDEEKLIQTPKSETAKLLSLITVKVEELKNIISE